MKLTDYSTLGHSGLIVSPFTLGTMTFGTERWGASDEVSEAVFNGYIDAGGNSIDTADIYAGGRSEELVGQFLAARKLRDQVVLATKFGFNGQGLASQGGNPLAGGNGRKNIHRALEGSLRRLKTDYIDLYWLHIWDMVTPIEEVMQTLGNLVRAGTIRYFAFSDMPAWYAMKAATLAQVQGVPGPIAMQMEYSLVSRIVEFEHLPAAHEGGLGVIPWSPLAGGFLSGKYSRGDHGARGEGRLSGSNPFGNSKFTERNWQILEVLKMVAAELDRPLAQVALAWVSQQPGVTSVLLGASKVEQLQGHLASLNIVMTPYQLQRLHQVSVFDPSQPDGFFSDGLKQMLFGGHPVRGWR